MKNVLFSLFGLLFFLSCSAVRFENPQPIGNKELKKLPSKLTGYYVDHNNGDTLILKSTSYIFKLNPFLKTDHKEIKFSSDSIVLKKYKSFYVLSSRGVIGDEISEELKGWDVVLLEFIHDSIKVFSINTYEEESVQTTVSKLTNILPVESVLNPNEDEEGEYFLINPSKRQFRELIHQDIFSVCWEFKRVDD